MARRSQKPFRARYPILTRFFGPRKATPSYNSFYRDMRYAGKVGTGFDEETLASLHRKFEGLIREKSPFSSEVRERDVTFLAPRLVAQISFTEWTKDGRLRHPVYLGLRDDKSAKEVVRQEV
jgi:bifunctional non-homologous end joining protein LigD